MRIPLAAAAMAAGLVGAGCSAQPQTRRGHGYGLGACQQCGHNHAAGNAHASQAATAPQPAATPPATAPAP